MKPLISLNSCLTVPPCFLALSLALGTVSAERTKSGCVRSDVLVDLLGRSSLLQGDLSRLIVSRDDDSWAAACSLTHIVHGRHLEISGCNGCTKGSDRY